MKKEDLLTFKPIDIKKVIKGKSAKLASLLPNFIIKYLKKILHEKEIPLLSCPDIKFFFALTLNRKANDPDQVWSLIQKRHEQRQNDLNRYK